MFSRKRFNTDKDLHGVPSDCHEKDCNGRCWDCESSNANSTIRNDNLRVLGGVAPMPTIPILTENPKTLGKIQNISGKNKYHGYAETNTGKIQNLLGKMLRKNNAEMTALQFALAANVALQILFTERGQYPCKDRTIVAVLVDSGNMFIGTNAIGLNVENCARNQAKQTINQGYAVCKEQCLQNAHAERDAITRWLASGVGYWSNNSPKMYVYGAKQMCNDCVALCAIHGISVEKVTPDLYDFIYHFGA